MTNNENKTAEEIYLEHVGKAVNARSVYYARAIQAMHHFALQQSQSALGEKQNEVDNLNKRLYDASKDNAKLIADLTTKDKELKDMTLLAHGYHKEIEDLKIQYKVLDEENSELVKEIEKLSKNDTIWREEHSKLAKEIEELKLRVIYERALATKKDERIKELEEGLKKIRGIIFLDNYKNPMNNTDMYNICESLLSQSKEQKEGENYCNCNTPKDFDKDWIGKLCPDCSKEIVGPF